MALVQVLFLGSGDAFFGGGRHHAAYLVRSPDGVLLLDCGASTLAALKQQKVDIGAIDRILISHLHGDHFGGIPFLLLEYLYEQPRQRALGIAGPPGTEARVRALFSAAYKDIAARPLPFPLEFSELLPDQPVSFGQIRIKPFAVPHQEKETSLGFDVHVSGRRVVYSGDTGWTEELITRSRDADLFICECCYFETRHVFHLDYPRLAENRGRFTAKRMILTHLGHEVLARREQIDFELAFDGMLAEIE
jgi:ribonuclease BN (tRNA processing enzyme)